MKNKNYFYSCFYFYDFLKSKMVDSKMKMIFVLVGIFVVGNIAEESTVTLADTVPSTVAPLPTGTEIPGKFWFFLASFLRAFFRKIIQRFFKAIQIKNVF